MAEKTSAIEKSAPQSVEVRPDHTPWANGWTYRPNVDVIDSPEEYVIFADVPGATREAIDIGFEDGVLSITARVPDRYRNLGDARVRHREFGIGNFHRRFEFGDAVDPDNAAAECRDGVLAVRLPKKAESRRRRIPVHS